MTTWQRPRRVIRARARRWCHRGIPWCFSYKLLQSTRGLSSQQQWRQKIMKLNVSSYKNIVWKNPTKGYSSAETHVVESWAWVHIRCSVIRECTTKRLAGENLWTSLVAKPQCTLLLRSKLLTYCHISQKLYTWNADWFACQKNSDHSATCQVHLSSVHQLLEIFPCFAILTLCSKPSTECNRHIESGWGLVWEPSFWWTHDPCLIDLINNFWICYTSFFLKYSFVLRKSK